MTTWDLNRLRYTIRKITGKYDITQLPNSSIGEVNISNPSGIDDYINDFYLYDFPEHFKTLKLRDFYTFTTVPNCGTYALPQNIYQVMPPIYVDNYQFAWYQSPDVFYRIWPELNFIDQNRFSPDGFTKTFSFNLTQTPVQQGTVVIGLLPNQDGNPSPILETFTDTDHPIPLDLPAQQYFVNPGTLTGNQGGTGKIDYLTGVINITYSASNVAPPAGIKTSCHYHPYVASRSRDIMFYQQQLFLRPIPNDTYSVKLMSYIMPTVAISAATNTTVLPSTDAQGNIQGFTTSNPLSNATNVPLYNEWWQLIAYGASIKIFIEDGEHEEAERYKGYFEEQKLLAQRREIKQFSSQRIPTAYAENQAGSPAWPIFPLY
jgi:hypothetical protein